MGGRSFQNAKGGGWVVPKMEKVKVNIETSKEVNFLCNQSFYKEKINISW